MSAKVTVPMFAGSRASAAATVREEVSDEHAGNVTVDLTAVHAMSGGYADELLVELLVRRSVSSVTFVSEAHDWSSQVGKLSAHHKLMRQARIHGVEDRVDWQVKFD